MAAYPAMALFVEAERNGEGQRIVCELDGFYPEAFAIKWERYTLKDPHFRVITDGIVTGPTVKNEDGTFRVTSSLALKPALQDRGIIYHCVVSHRSLLVPKKLNLTLPEKGKHPPPPTHTHLRTRDWMLGILRSLGSLLGKERKFGAKGEQASSSAQTPELAVQI